jgi:gluconate:H+ symporter, GntP family
MIEGPMLLGILLLAVAFIVIATSWVRLHPFLALLAAAFLTGLLVRMPLADLVQAINGGFGAIMGSIGLVIVLGTMIGTILERAGGALKMADVVIRRVGEKRPQLAMSLIGAIVSIPVFCDSGYVILASLKRAVARRAEVALASMTVALATGLYATHTLVPPTPGPIAAAGALGADGYLGTIILVGLVVSVPTIFAGYLWATRVAVRIRIPGESDGISCEEMTTGFGSLPPAWKAFAPILVPILLIAVGSVVSLVGYTGPGSALLRFLGAPVVALLVGLVTAFPLMPKYEGETLTDWMAEGIRTAAPILLITGAGGAFGRVLTATPIAEVVKGLADGGLSSGPWALVLAFVVAAGLKTAQGSSTASLVVTSSLMAPLIVGMGVEGPLHVSLFIMAIGAGAMTVSHANDSFFWVVTQFSGMNVKDAYTAQTLATLVQGLTALATTCLLYLILV